MYTETFSLSFVIMLYNNLGYFDQIDTICLRWNFFFIFFFLCLNSTRKHYLEQSVENGFYNLCIWKIPSFQFFYT